MTTEEAKKEAVRKAYGEYWEQLKSDIDENGWVKNVKHDFLDWEDLMELEREALIGYNAECIGVESWRPKSLSGVEDNNGWIRIEPDGSNLPEEKAEYWGMVLIQGKRQAAHVPFEPSNVMKSFWMKFVSHYQPIIKPEPPIY